MTAPPALDTATMREPVRRQSTTRLVRRYGALGLRGLRGAGPAARFARTAPTVRRRDAREAGRPARRACHGAFSLGVAPTTPKGGGG